MAIDDFLESEIRTAIINKVSPSKINKSGKHWKCYIYINTKMVAKVKVPNDHNRVMKESKSKYIAQSLKLNHENFNELIVCTLSGTQYYKILEKFK